MQNLPKDIACNVQVLAQPKNIGIESFDCMEILTSTFPSPALSPAPPPKFLTAFNLEINSDRTTLFFNIAI